MSDKNEHPSNSCEDIEEFESDVQTINDFISIFVASSEQVKTLDDSRTLLYRGQADKSFGLTPSVFRNGLLQKEHIMIQQLLSKAADDFAEVRNPFERLVKMQHYGLPTRLLDITINPLVALYFACIDCSDKDGEIIVFYDYMHNHGETDVRIMSTLSEYHGKSEQAMRTFLTEREFDVAKINTGDLLKIPYLLVDPPMNNERIKRQSGAFAIIGIRRDAEGYEKQCHDLRTLIVLKENEGIERSITISKNSKAQLLSALDVIGINKAFLFPELEHQTAYLKSKYEVK
jgi:hypothetical protein